MRRKGEPLSREGRFRLRAYTGTVLVMFFASHASALLVMAGVCTCQAFDISNMGAGTVRMLIYGTTALLYFAAWIEVTRMLYARWWPHWGTLASDTDPHQAAGPVVPGHVMACAILAVIDSLLILSCEAREPGLLRLTGGYAGVLTGIGGAVATQFGAWFVRVSEPFLPIPPPKKS